MNDSVSDAYVFAHDPLCPWMQPCPGSYEGKPHELIPLDSPDLNEVCYNCTSTKCRCNLIAKVREDTLAVAMQRVEALGQQHPKWDAISTHYEGCWKHHAECALTLAIAAIKGDNDA